MRNTGMSRRGVSVRRGLSLRREYYSAKGATPPSQLRCDTSPYTGEAYLRRLFGSPVQGRHTLRRFFWLPCVRGAGALAPEGLPLRREYYSAKGATPPSQLRCDTSPYTGEAYLRRLFGSPVQGRHTLRRFSWLPCIRGAGALAPEGLSLRREYYSAKGATPPSQLRCDTSPYTGEAYLRRLFGSPVQGRHTLLRSFGSPV